MRGGYAVKAWRELPRFSFVGAEMRAMLSPTETRALSCYHIALEDGGEIPAAYHKKAFELIWVLSGRGTAVLGSRRVRLVAGDSLLIRPPTPHGFAAGRGGMSFFAALSPRVDSRTDYYSCDGGHHGRPRMISGRFLEGNRRAVPA